MRRSLSRVTLLLSILAILVATLLPAPGERSTQWWNCLACGVRGSADLLLNAVLFVPFGMSLAANGARLPRAALLGALLSAGIEVAQLYIPGRDSTLADIVGNTLGTALGAAIVTSVSGWLAPPPGARATALFRAAAVAAIAVFVCTGLLLSPSFPISHYFGLWTPDLGQMLGYRGRVESASLGSYPIDDGPLPDSRAVRARLIADSGYVIDIRGIAGPRPPRLAPLLAIFDDQNREIVMVAPDRDDLAFRFRTRGVSWRLDRPDIRLINGMQRVTNGEPLAISVSHASRGYRIEVDGYKSRVLGFTVGSGWGLLLYPEPWPPLVKKLLAALWVGALYLPLGFWARSRADGLIACAAVVAGLVGAPAVTTLIATPLYQWLAAAVGLLAGRGIHVVSSAANALTQRSMRE